MTGERETHGGLSVTDFGRVSAVLRHFGSGRASEVLARLGLSESGWAAAQAAWTQALDQDAEGAPAELLVAWNDAFEATRRDLAARKPDIAGIEPLKVEPTPVAQPAPAPPPPDVPPPPLVVPKIAAVPSEDGPSPWATLSTSREPAPPVTQALDVKTLPSASDILAAALPFKEPESLEIKPKEARPLVKRKPVFTGTKDVDERKLLQAILPFGLPAPPAGAPPATPLPALSPSPAPAGPYSLLTIEQYASFVAELATYPARAGEIQAKYFVVGELLIGALHAAWQERFREDPALMDRFQELYARYRAWLMRKER